eukprot:1149948-Pelagomonas_calceolata.AAC.5
MQRMRARTGLLVHELLLHVLPPPHCASPFFFCVPPLNACCFCCLLLAAAVRRLCSLHDLLQRPMMGVGRVAAAAKGCTAANQHGNKNAIGGSTQAADAAPSGSSL